MTDGSKGEKMSALGELRRGIQRQLHQLIISSNSEMLYRLGESIQDEIEDKVDDDKVKMWNSMTSSWTI